MLDITGKIFGRWKVKEFDLQRSKPKLKFWLCVCECGAEKAVASGRLLSGRSRSCGCLREEIRTAHGKHKSKVYQTWEAMLQRCTNRNHNSYCRYGGRGIAVCKSWQVFENFYKDMGERPEGASLDRIDNNLGYCKENCRWATTKEQARNKSSNVYYTVDDKQYILADLCEERNLQYKKTYDALRKGKTLETVLKDPKFKRPHLLRLGANGQYDTQALQAEVLE